MSLPKKIFGAAVASLSMSACVSPYADANGLYASSISNAPVTANPTPCSMALACAANDARATGKPAPRLAVVHRKSATFITTQRGS
jgi:hypothetical protein